MMISVGKNVPGISLLYVDDEPDLLDIGKLYLERGGEIIVTTALNAHEAIRLLSEQAYDAIVSDYQMPEMDGIAFLKHLKAAGSTTPFIIFTGKGREEVVIEALNEGADFYLQKGGNPKAQFAELSNKIRYAVSRRRAEDSLQTSEEKYRHLIEHSDEAIIVAQDDMVRRVNHRAVEFTGCSEQELLSMPFPTFIHPDDRAMVADKCQKRTSGEEPPLSRYAFRLILKDGSTRWVEISDIVIDWEGRPATMNFLTDITKRRRAEDALRESEEKYRTIFENTGTAMVVVEESNIISLANEEFAHLSGFSKGDIEGNKSWTEFVVGEDLERMLAQHRLRKQNREKALTHYEFRFVTKSGDIRTVHLTIEVIPGTKKSVASLLDITEQKRAEQALQESKVFLQKIINALSHPVFVKDRQHRLILVNDAACALFDRSREELIGSISHELFPTREMADISLEKDEEVFRSGVENANVETNIYGPGRTFTVIVRKTLYTDNEGNQFLVGITTDITDLKQAEETLQAQTNLLTSMINSSPEFIIFSLDREYRYIAFNEMYRKEMRWVWKTDIRIGMSILDCMTDTVQRRAAQESIDRALRGEQFTEIQHQPGLGIWSELNWNPIRQSTGDIMGVTVFIRDIAKRKASEQALRESETRFRELFTKIRSGVAIYEAVDDGTDFVFKDFNPAAEIIETRKREDVIGRRISEVFPGVRDFKLLDVLERVWRTGQPEQHPISIYKDDLIEGWRDNFVYRLPSGEIVTVYDDVTKQKQADEVLKKSEEKYRIYIDNSPEGIFILDAAGNFQDINPCACSMLGYSREELLSLSIRDLVPAGTRTSAPPDFFKVLETGSLMTEAMLLKKNGDSLPVVLNAVLLPDERHLVYCADITERKRVEKALREHEAQLHAILQGSPTPKFVIDRDHRVISWNRALEESTGIEARDILGTNEHWRAFYNHERPCLADILLEEAIEKIPVMYEGKYKKSDVVEGGYEATDFFPNLGEKGKWLSFVAASIQDADGKVIGAVQTFEDITGMKEAEQSLRESEQRYYNIIEDQTEFVCRFKPDGTHVFVNKAYAEYFGTTRDEMTGHIFRPNIFPDDREKVREFFATLTPAHPVDFIKQRIIMPDGEVRWQRWSDRAIFDRTGSVVEYQSVGRDITLQKMAGAALVDSESFNRGLVENLPDYIVVCTPDGKILYVNPPLARVFDCRADDLVGTPLLSYIVQEHRDRAASSMAARREGREIPPYETDILTRDGTRRSVIVKGTSIHYQNSPAVLLVLSDITERKRAEETQQHLTEFQKSVIINASVWLSVLDLTGKILMWNRAAEEISGYGSDEVIGKNEIWKIIYPEKEYRKQITDTIARIIRDKEYLENFETAIQSKQGEKKVISWNTKGIPDATGSVSSYIAIGVDVTDRHLAEEALKQANRQVNLLSSITRHDILNQLMVLKGYIQFAQEDLDDKEILLKHLEKQLKATETIEEQIMFTRDYQEMGANAPEWQNVSVNITKAKTQLPLRDISISVDGSDLEIFVDPLFEKVFYNLFDNALRHGGDQMKTIRISSQESGLGRTIVCEDDGVGISPEDKARLFTRGFGKNTGLGLFLSREILGITGISIKETGEPGKGARFEIAVPKGVYQFRRSHES